MFNSIIASFLDKWKAKSPTVFLSVALVLIAVKGGVTEMNNDLLLPSWIDVRVIDWLTTIVGLFMGARTTPFLPPNDVSKNDQNLKPAPTDPTIPQT